METMLWFVVIWCVNFLFTLDLPDDGPIITGGFPRYHIGDKVEVNCTSYRSKPAAKLKWYINGEQADRALVKHFPVSLAIDLHLPKKKLKL